MHLGIIVILTLGGLTMLYPFTVMISGSFRSEMDQAELDLMPDFWTQQEVLYQKFLETKYNQSVVSLNRAHKQRYFGFADAPTPEADASPERIRNWIVDTYDGPPAHWQVLGGIVGVRTVPENLREYRRRLAERFDGDLDAFTRATGTPELSWQAIVLAEPKWLSRQYDGPDSVVAETYTELLQESDPAERQLVSLSGHMLDTIIYPRYSLTSLAKYNLAHTRKLGSYGEFRLSPTVPGEDQPTLRAEWIEYVTQELHSSFILLDDVTQADYNTFQTKGDAPSNPECLVPHNLPDGRTWLTGEAREVYEAFLDTVPIEHYRITGPEFIYGQSAFFHDVPAMEWAYARDNAWDLRRIYSIRNYVNVFDELILQGRALFNTLVFCAMSIVLALLINPLAAYSLSRYKLRGTYKILLLLMATMAFPPMVSLIPQFILLRHLNLLNTYVALVLPVITNGYMIFLLKGFFDTLPKELYESARIDGAGDWRVFFQITLALSKPILAVLALGTFTNAYMMFLHALLVCPDPDMWLISVWLFQFQGRASSPGVFAAVIIASIPTLLIFLVTQRTIMRGIVVPTEK